MIVVCPDLSHLVQDHHNCAGLQGVSEICAIVQLETVPTLPHPLPPRSLPTDMFCDNLSLLITSSSSSSLSPSSSTLTPKMSQSFLPDPNHLLLTLLPWCIPVLDHIAAKGLGSQSDSTPATAFRSSCPPSYEYNTDLMRRWTDNLMTR